MSAELPMPLCSSIASPEGMLQPMTLAYACECASRYNARYGYHLQPARVMSSSAVWTVLSIRSSFVTCCTVIVMWQHKSDIDLRLRILPNHASAMLGVIAEHL